MKESELRDIIANNIDILEHGLVLLEKEQFIPNPFGTKGFIDLYAKDAQGNHVLIELKRSDAASREALHEIHKYAEGVKHYFGARDNELRIIIASTEWRELLVPFSRFVADTTFSIMGLQINFNENLRTFSVSQVAILPINQGRFIAPWHDMNWYLDEDSINHGINSIESSCNEKGIKDYVIVVLRFPQPVSSEKQGEMRSAIIQMGGLMGVESKKSADELPLYKYIAYFAMQILSKEQYLDILRREPERFEDSLELYKEMDDEEALGFLHESVTSLNPSTEKDFYEIGYPAKFTKYLDQYDCEIQEIKRYGTFERNLLLDDNIIISEIRGEDGATGQRLKRRVSISSRAQMTSIRSDIETCLGQNPVWKNHILRSLNEIQKDFPEAELDISIYNPSTGVFTIYFAVTREDGILFVPTYSLTIFNPEPIRIYYGAIQEDGQPLTFRQILNKYYNGDFGSLLFTLTWGGRDSRDSDIVEDLGCAYRSFRCDLENEKRSFFMLRDERWRKCEPIKSIDLYGEYIEKNEKLITQIVNKISPRINGGITDASYAERLLDEIANIRYGEKHDKYLVSNSEECGICGSLLSEEKYKIDGKIKGLSQWANICPDCFIFCGEGIKWGTGQLYLRQGKEWLLVGGYEDEV